VGLVERDENLREQAMQRWRVLRPHVEDGVALSAAAEAAGVPLRTAQRWLERYRADGLAGLARRGRGDRGVRRLPCELVELVEGLALRRPRPSVAFIHRQVLAAAARAGWPAPSYSTVYGIVRHLDPGLLTLAHDGPARYRDRYELVYRRQAERPNDVWQADHTLLDVLVLDPTARPARPWLTVILDDHSRAAAGYTVSLDAPSSLQTALALRQAIWRKSDPAWPVCGIPGVLYSDHGSDFTSRHLEQVCVDLHVQLIHSTAGVPQGRGKIERYFGTVTTELLPALPGYLAPGAGGPATPPALSLAELDDAIGRFIIDDYHAREHSETREAPAARWLAGGWLPRLPESLEQLDLLLLTVAKPRVVHRDGIRFQGLRYLDLTLAAYVGEPVTIRYDPRDLGEIRVFHHDRFLCRAIAPELADQTISLRELQAARTAQRRALRAQLRQRRSVADALCPPPSSAGFEPREASPPAVASTPSPPRLRRYREE
jgi:putative transposase